MGHYYPRFNWYKNGAGAGGGGGGAIIVQGAANVIIGRPRSEARDIDMRACHRERLTVELAEHAERAGEERAPFREIDPVRPRPGERGMSSGGDHETNRSVEVRRERWHKKASR